MRRFAAVISIATLTFGTLLLPVESSVRAGSCTTIQDGGITDVKGNPLTLGYDQWGYNYQAHIFNGLYDNYLRPDVPATTGDNLQMKWNDEWLSNRDCDFDGKLDRPSDHGTYVGSDAWLTNHQWGSYIGNDGRTYKWDYYVLVVAVPVGAVLDGATWKSATGDVIGYSIWGQFAVVQEVYNDQGTGQHGLLYKGPKAPGLGSYK